MAYEPKYLPSDLLTKVVEYLGIPDSTPSMTFPFKLFKKIMQDETMDPVISCLRTIKEKYRDLQDSGFISDSDIPRLDLEAAREYISEVQKKKAGRSKGAEQ